MNDLDIFFGQIVDHYDRVRRRNEDPKESVIVAHPYTLRKMMDRQGWYPGDRLPDSILGFKVRADDTIREGQVFIMKASVLQPLPPPLPRYRIKPIQQWEGLTGSPLEKLKEKPVASSVEARPRKIQMPEEGT